MRGMRGSIVAGVVIITPPTPLAIPPPACAAGMLPLLPGVPVLIVIVSMPASVVGSAALLAPLAPIFLFSTPPPPFLLARIGVTTAVGATAPVAPARVGALPARIWLLLFGFTSS